MPVQIAELEQAIRDAFPVSHLEIEDQSSGCGESYSVLLVSEVGTRSSVFMIDQRVRNHPQAFEKKTTLARHRLSGQTLFAMNSLDSRLQSTRR